MQKNPEENKLNPNIHAWLMGQQNPKGKKTLKQKKPIKYVYIIVEKASCTGNGAKKTQIHQSTLSCLKSLKGLESLIF